MQPKILTGIEQGCIIRVLVRPNAPNSTIREVTDEALLVDIKAPPEKDKANKELIRLLSEVFEVPKVELAIVLGTKSREKHVQIGRPMENICQKLGLPKRT
jgi:uncharacterized protein (TIGR00251 family)